MWQKQDFLIGQPVEIVNLTLLPIQTPKQPYSGPLCRPNRLARIQILYIRALYGTEQSEPSKRLFRRQSAIQCDTSVSV